MDSPTCHIQAVGRKDIHLRVAETGSVDAYHRSWRVSFAEGPTLKEQYWWTWGSSLTFVLLKRNEWILVGDRETNGLDQEFVHLKDRFVDLTRITSELVNVLTHNATESVPRD